MASDYTLNLKPRGIQDDDPQIRAILQRAKSKLGFVPNMYAGMANVPGLLETYMDGYDRFRLSSGFTPAEQEVIFLTVSRANACEYCMAAHCTLADHMSKVPQAVTAAIRSGGAVPDPKLAAVSAFTDAMLDTRGQPTVAQVEAFLTAGYTENHVLQVVLAIAVKTLSNYANHLLHTPLDDMFAAQEWKKPAAVCNDGCRR